MNLFSNIPVSSYSEIDEARAHIENEYLRQQDAFSREYLQDTERALQKEERFHQKAQIDPHFAYGQLFELYSEIASYRGFLKKERKRLRVLLCGIDMGLERYHDTVAAKVRTYLIETLTSIDTILGNSED